MPRSPTIYAASIWPAVAAMRIPYNASTLPCMKNTSNASLNIDSGFSQALHCCKKSWTAGLAWYQLGWSGYLAIEMVFHTCGVFANVRNNGHTDAIRKRSSEDWVATYNITLNQANSGMKAWGISKWICFLLFPPTVVKYLEFMCFYFFGMERFEEWKRGEMRIDGVLVLL
ncbi:hypothetical protein Pyn_22070 [Prunus yedoensis var. nudiflora]|uniref:Uncharacterized protein n=1 Tax=Prunus yedoensis var. nudiflora TaxID=2094558 RepID=A0A314XWN3_PRUYE|nr:hypothetical protein Pyn_22070 [Prunus yedoensis var. nudiflora]